MPSIAQAVLEAESLIRPYVRTTPVEESSWFGRGVTQVWFKHEQLQHTGSFKVRGAFSKLLSLSEAERRLGVVAASTGNHGAAVAYAGEALHTKVLVFVPHGASATKVEAIKRFGAVVEMEGEDPVDTEAFARRYAAASGMAYLSPYNDMAVLAGQGTIGIELLEQMPTPDAVFASLGGGGMLSGIAGYLKSIAPNIEVIGCSPVRSAAMIASVEHGVIVEVPGLPTLSDGTAGGIEPGAITFPICQDLVDDYVRVTEEEIASALRQFMGVHHKLIEGAAATALAGFQKTRTMYAGKRVAIVLCGANISLDTLRAVLDVNQYPTVP